MDSCTFNSLFAQCEKFYFRHPFKDSLNAFIAPASVADFLSFLKEWNSGINADMHSLVFAEYLSKSPWKNKRLTVYAMSKKEIENCLQYHTGGTTLEHILSAFPYPPEEKATSGL